MITESTEAELMEEVKDGDTNAEEAPQIEPEALNDGIEVADLTTEKGQVEKLKPVEEAADPKEEDIPDVAAGLSQQDVVLPEY